MKQKKFRRAHLHIVPFLTLIIVIIALNCYCYYTGIRGISDGGNCVAVSQLVLEEYLMSHNFDLRYQLGGFYCNLQTALVGEVRIDYSSHADAICTDAAYENCYRSAITEGDVMIPCG